MKTVTYDKTHKIVEIKLLEDTLQVLKELWYESFEGNYCQGDDDTIDALLNLLHPPEEEEADMTCPTCNGCGEGAYEGSDCFNCGGKGEVYGS